MIPLKYNQVFEEVSHLCCGHASNSVYSNLKITHFCLAIKDKIDLFQNSRK